MELTFESKISADKRPFIWQPARGVWMLSKHFWTLETMSITKTAQIGLHSHTLPFKVIKIWWKCCLKWMPISISKTISSGHRSSGLFISVSLRNCPFDTRKSIDLSNNPNFILFPISSRIFRNQAKWMSLKHSNQSMDSMRFWNWSLKQVKFALKYTMNMDRTLIFTDN